MNVIFGQELEGCGVPGSREGLNVVAFGPRGLIDFLELRLGLSPVTMTETTRLLIYREALQAAVEKQDRFFSDSFLIDPIGSSKVLLKWRDQLRLNGWNSSDTFRDAAPARLSDLAAVDLIFCDICGGKVTDEASRLERIAAQLDRGLSPKIDRIDLMETPEHFPIAWQSVLKKIPVEEDAFSAPQEPLASPGSALQIVQSRLLGESKAPAKFDNEDQSIRIIRDSIYSKNADAAAQHLANLGSENQGSAVLISDPRKMAFLEAALQNLDQPGPGSGTRTSFGSLVQLAPVVLQLHWGPFNPQSWLEFFLHPVSPISRKLARRLSSSLNEIPSRENPSWHAGIDAVLTSSDDAARIKQQIERWLNPVEFSNEADTAVLAKTIRQLGAWMGKRGSLVQPELPRSQWFAASGAMEDLASSIESVKVINRENLARIVAEWLPGASSGEITDPDLGAPRRISSPAQLLDPTDHVIWWQAEERKIPRLPWAKEETTWLAERSVIFPDHDLLRHTTTARYRRAILQARKSVTIFSSPQNRGMEAAVSPLLVRLEAEFGSAMVRDSDTLIQTEACKVIHLPVKKPAWKVSCPELLSARESESFSSLSKFVYAPWDWVFTYKARLRPGPLVDYRIVDDARRQGSLLHGFVESLLEPDPEPLDLDDRNLPGAGSSGGADNPVAGLLETLVRRLFSGDAPVAWDQISKDAVTAWVTSQWEEILRQQAAQYLVPGNEASRSELLYIANNGLWELLQHLKSSRIVSVVCEEVIREKKFIGGLFGGIIDLRVANEEGEVGVIDLKLGGRSNRIDEMVKGRHLQLAIYGQLVEQEHESQAHAAYFIFSGGGALLARSDRFFRKATVVTKTKTAASDDWQICWRDFLPIWKARREELNAGKIEVDLNGYGSSIPKNWKIKEPAKYSSFLHLVGWDETS